MNDLKTTSALVKSILENSKPARNSDSNLYLQVLFHVAEQKGIDIHDMTVPAFLSVGDSLGFPGFETVRRTRQKIQQHHPELAASETVQDFRAQKETEYRAYARCDV